MTEMNETEFRAFKKLLHVLYRLDLPLDYADFTINIIPQYDYSRMYIIRLL